MIRHLVRGSVAAVGLFALASPAAAFQSGDVYWAPGACGAPPCYVSEVDAGFGVVTPFVAVDPAPGQLTWEADRSAAYASQFASGTVVRITSAGSASTFAWGIVGATGLLKTSDGTLLAVSYNGGTVYDATMGGDLSAATPFASGFTTPRNLIERSNGDLLLVDQTARVVFDISAGGDFFSATPFASGFAIGAYDLVEDGSGNLYLSTRLGVYDITAGEGFSEATAFAWGRFLVGLAIDGAGRLLASEFETGAIFDISAGGDVASAVPIAVVSSGLGDTALDTVPSGGPETPQVPALGPLAYGLLASLLVASGARSRPR